MKSRIIRSLIDTGSAARDFIRLAKNASSRAIKGMDESHGREAQEILESIQDQEDSGYELDIDISGQNLIDRMDRDFEDMGLVPYFFSSAAREAGEGISVGSYVSIPDDDRKFRVVSISRRNGSVQIRDADGNQYLVPWQLPKPWRESNDNLANTSPAQRKSIDSKMVIEAVGNWFFGRSRVYQLSEPDRILKQRKIHWDRETCDVQDEDGTVFFNVPWDSLEFADEVEFHLPDEG